MFYSLTRLFNDQADQHLRARLRTLYALLLAANLGAWAWAFAVFRDHPALLASSLLAWTLGLRHAIDADHIAAIDTVTRKLVQEGKQPIATGFFFALGHSTVVTLIALAVGVAAAALSAHFGAMQNVGSVVGTVVSASYLLLLALFNLAILVPAVRNFRAVQRGGALHATDLDLLGGGLVSRLCRPLFRLASRSWHMYPAGFLFGLGFDTASEVALFALAALQLAQGAPLWSVMVFPALFAAGMALVDTLDGNLMMTASGWAQRRPIRKLFYNLTITLVSVLVASGVAAVEILGLVRERMALTGWFWVQVGALNDHFGTLGYVIVALFTGTWLVALAVYRVKRYDRIEVVVTPGGATARTT
ncbi:HoxN/HupN/NixA family nickel/cobalt transporter [Massilia sp. S19_KUP03_FR1]|uniref:HoxN/HupN/NixA family nickel/cobalt transporter n=1 Tax=Massilia sp. S19_KUP03_FR1 TaxID=3025503 RepID=UPI002FCDDD2E